MLRAASTDVRYLPHMHSRMRPLLSAPLLRRLALRSSLRARSYCSESDPGLDWPQPQAYPLVWDSRDGSAEGVPDTETGEGSVLIRPEEKPRPCPEERARL